MGNIDSRAKNSAGYLLLQTSQPFYEPGSAITGNIYMRTTIPIAATHIEMEIKGKEAASFIHFRYETETNADGTTSTRRVAEKKKSHRKVIEYKAPVFLFQGGNLVPGDYCVPFSF